MKLRMDVRVASVFRNGRNQSIRLPRHMELDADEVLIERHGEVLTIRPRPGDWDHSFATCPSFDPDFPSDIDGLPAEEAVSAVVVAELAFGSSLAGASRRTSNQEALDGFLVMVAVEDWPAKAAAISGERRAALRRSVRAASRGLVRLRWLRPDRHQARSCLREAGMPRTPLIGTHRGRRVRRGAWATGASGRTRAPWP